MNNFAEEKRAILCEVKLQMITMEATWETWSPWGTNYRKEWDAHTKAQTGGQRAKETWGTASAPLLEDMIVYKGKEGDFL